MAKAWFAQRWSGEPAAGGSFWALYNDAPSNGFIYLQGALSSSSAAGTYLASGRGEGGLEPIEGLLAGPEEDGA